MKKKLIFQAMFAESLNLMSSRVVKKQKLRSKNSISAAQKKKNEIVDVKK